MSQKLAVVALVVCLFLATNVPLLVSAGNAVKRLTGDDIDRITSHYGPYLAKDADASGGATTTNSPTWIVRFVVPWEETDSKAADAFTAVAGEFSPAAVQFGVVEVDSPDAIALADSLGVGTLPSIRVFGARVARPEVPRGGRQSARPIGLEHQHVLQGAKQGTDMTQLRRFVQSALPNRYQHPLSNAVIPTVFTVNSMKDIVAAAKASSFPKAPIFVFFGRKEEIDMSLLATLYGQGARLKGRGTIAFCSNSPLSREYDLTLGTKEKGISAAVLQLDNSGEGLKKIATQDDIAQPEQIVSLLEKESVSFEQYQSSLLTEQESWEEDMATFVSSSPLRKIDTAEQFEREIMNTKHAVCVIFLLRESDPYFARQEKTAVDVAKFALEYHTHSLTTKEPIPVKNQFRPDVYWIDPEVHPNLAKALGAKEVPSIAVLLHLQNDMKGVKFVKEGKDFPTGVKVSKFLQSERLFDVKDVVALNVDALQFSSKVPQRKNTRSADNNQYLNIDHIDYGKDLEPSNLVQSSIDAAAEAAAEAKKNPKKKLSPKAEKKRQEKAAAEKEKIREELEAKKKAREERMRLKAEKAAAEKAAKAEELAKKRTEQASKPKGAKKPKSKKAKKKPAAPKQPKQKPPKDLAAERKWWEAESQRMTDKYLTIDNAAGTVKIHHSLSPPRN